MFFIILLLFVQEHKPIFMSIQSLEQHHRRSLVSNNPYHQTMFRSDNRFQNKKEDNENSTQFC